MDWLNYHHLLYFFVTARTGSVSRAAGALGLAQPTVSAQLKKLERSLGQPLFHRVGRGLELTDAGRTVYAYAEEIFSLGDEMLATVRQHRADRSQRLRVGVADVVPKMVAELLLRPALALTPPVHLVCREGKAEALESELGRFGFDLVLTDTPLSPAVRVRAFTHDLGASGVALFATAPLAKKHRPGFPGSLDGAPLLLPTEGTVVRRELDAALRSLGVRPHVVAEFEDSALLKVFGRRGLGIFPGPDILAEEVCRRYGVVRLGAVEGVEERFYAITLERRITHPAVAAIRESAQRRLG